MKRATKSLHPKDMIKSELPPVEKLKEVGDFASLKQRSTERSVVNYHTP